MKKDWITNNDSDFYLARLTPSGGLDAAFNGDGTSIIPFDWQPAQTSSRQNDYGQVVALQPNDGKVLIAGLFMGWNNWEYGVSRVLATLPPKEVTTTTLSASATSTSVGDPVTFVVDVSPTTARGNVELDDGNIRLSSGPLVNGRARFTFSGLGIGAHGISARFLESATHAGSSSTPLTINVAALISTLDLVPSATSAVFATPLTFTATVNPAQATGTVEFFDGAVSLGSVPVRGGAAALVTDRVLVGARTITARYSGDPTYASAGSPARIVTIARATASLVLELSPTSQEYGGRVDISMAVEPARSSGTVIFRDGATELGRADLVGGRASWNTNSLGLGAHAISAIYAGDANVAGGTSSTATIQVRPANTIISNVSAPAQVGYRAAIPLVASIMSAAGTVSGRLRFVDGTIDLSTADFVNGVARLTLNPGQLAPGTHVITAIFDSQGVFAASNSSPISIRVMDPIPTMTTLTANVGPIVVGEGHSIAFDVQVRAPSGLPSGTVEFRDGDTLLDSVVLVNGAAGLSWSGFAPGTHAIQANYLGDASFAPGNAPLLSFELVLPVSTTLNITAGTLSPTFGAIVQLLATARGATTPTEGTVAFYDGTTLLGRADLTNGTALIQTTSLTAGDHALKGIYEGHERFLASESAVIGLTVAKAATVASLTPTNATVIRGATAPDVTLAMNVAGRGGYPTGSVAVFLGTQLLRTAAVVNGQATITTNQWPLGDNAITARYSGDSSYLPSETSPFAVSVRGLATVDLVVGATRTTVGRPIGFTARVASPFGLPTGSVEFFDGERSLGSAPVSSGRAVLVISNLSIGTHPLTARFGPTSPHVATLSAVTDVVVADTPGTAITALKVVRNGTRIIRVELRTNGPLNAATAVRMANYSLIYAGGDGRSGTSDDLKVVLSGVKFNAKTGTITLTPGGRWVAGGTIRLVVQGLTDGKGRPFDGNRDGQPGGRFSALITKQGWSFSSG